jgi:hypothetical protein
MIQTFRQWNRYKASRKQQEEIIAKLKAGERVKELAIDYGFSEGYIYYLRNKK